MSNFDKADELSPDEMRAAPKTGAQENVEPNEMTTWDGAGNPIKHVFADDESGHLSEGTGSDTDEALKDARDPSHILGPDASPDVGKGGSRHGKSD